MPGIFSLATHGTDPVTQAIFRVGFIAACFVACSTCAESTALAIDAATQQPTVTTTASQRPGETEDAADTAVLATGEQDARDSL